MQDDRCFTENELLFSLHRLDVIPERSASLLCSVRASALTCVLEHLLFCLGILCQYSVTGGLCICLRLRGGIKTAAYVKQMLLCSLWSSLWMSSDKFFFGTISVCLWLFLSHSLVFLQSVGISISVYTFFLYTVCKYTLHLQGHETKPRVLIIIKSILVFFSLLASFFSFIRESLSDVIGLSFFLFFFYLQLLFKYILKFQFSLLLS